MKKLTVLLIIGLLAISLVNSGLAQEEKKVKTEPKEMNREFKELRSIPKVVDRLRALKFLSIKRLEREEVMDIKDRLEECKDKEEVSDCKELRTEAKDWVKERLKELTERILNALVKLKEKINASDSENKQAILDEINSVIEQINAAKEKISLLNKESPKEEIKSSIAELKSVLKSAKEIIRKYHKSNISEERVRNTISRLNMLADKIITRLDRISQQRNIDFSSLKAKVERAKEKVANAEQNLLSGNKEEAIKLLKEAHSIILEVLKEFRASKTDSEDNPSEVENAE